MAEILSLEKSGIVISSTFPVFRPLLCEDAPRRLWLWAPGL